MAIRLSTFQSKNGQNVLIQVLYPIAAKASPIHIMLASATPTLSALPISTEATPERVRSENPDVVIIAAGSVPIIPQIPGINGENVVLAGNVDTGEAEVGNRVVVAGAGLTGSETALLLAQQGKEVTLIDMLSMEQIDTNAKFMDTRTLRRLLAENKVDIMTEVRLEAVEESKVIVTDKKGKKKEIPCDTVVLALGVRPREDIVSIFAGNYEVASLRGFGPPVKASTQRECVGQSNRRDSSALKAISRS